MRISGVPFVQGRNNYSDADGTKYGIAIHNTSNDASDEAEASYATRRTDGVSSHLYCDKDSVTQSLDTVRKAGHAGSYNGNEHAIAVEITGGNGWTRQQWLTNVAWEKLGAALAQVVRHYGIAVRRASIAEMQANPKLRAFYGHDDMRRAWGGTTHTDPGPNFPWDRLFSAVNAALNPTALEADVELTERNNQALYKADGTVPPPVLNLSVGEQLGFGFQFAYYAREIAEANRTTLAEIEQALASNAGGVLTPEQFEAFRSSAVEALRAGQEAWFAEKSGQVAELAAEAAVRKVLGSLDGATPES